MKKEYAILLAAVVVVGALVGYSYQSRSLGGNVSNANVFSGGVTDTSVSCSVASTVLAARNLNRQYLAIVNTDASNSVDIGLGNAAVLGSGVRIGPNRSSYEINSENLFVGAVNCIAQNATVTVQISEK